MVCISYSMSAISIKDALTLDLQSIRTEGFRNTTEELGAAELGKLTARVLGKDNIVHTCVLLKLR